MTEAQAIKFLQFRKRYMLGGENLSLGEIISLIRRSNVSMMVSGSVLLSTASILFSNHRTGYGLPFGAAEIVLGFVIIGYSAWSHIRLRQACRALNYATDGSSRLSGSK
jgi:hypothetical protein